MASHSMSNWSISFEILWGVLGPKETKPTKQTKGFPLLGNVFHNRPNIKKGKKRLQCFGNP